MLIQSNAPQRRWRLWWLLRLFGASSGHPGGVPVDRGTWPELRRVHPGVEGRLVGPDGTELDLLPLVRRATTEPSARAKLAAVMPSV